MLLWSYDEYATIDIYQTCDSDLLKLWNWPAQLGVLLPKWPLVLRSFPLPISFMNRSIGTYQSTTVALKRLRPLKTFNSSCILTLHSSFVFCHLRLIIGVFTDCHYSTKKFSKIIKNFFQYFYNLSFYHCSHSAKYALHKFEAEVMCWGYLMFFAIFNDIMLVACWSDTSFFITCHKCSIGFNSGLCPGQSRTLLFFFCRTFLSGFDVWHRAPSCMKTLQSCTTMWKSIYLEEI